MDVDEAEPDSGLEEEALVVAAAAAAARCDVWYVCFVAFAAACAAACAECLDLARSEDATVARAPPPPPPPPPPLRGCLLLEAGLRLVWLFERTLTRLAALRWVAPEHTQPFTHTGMN